MKAIFAEAPEIGIIPVIHEQIKPEYWGLSREKRTNHENCQWKAIRQNSRKTFRWVPLDKE